MKSLDVYYTNARVMPLLLVLFPLTLTVALWLPSATKWISGLVAGATALALSFLGAQISRQAGRSKEPLLWNMWDGKPSVRYLRHRNTEFNTISRAKCHTNLQAHFSDIKIPTAQEEQADPGYADEVYAACTYRLIGLTRDTSKHSLLYKENIAFGFLRNLWGLKTLGITVATLSLAAATLKLWLHWKAATTFIGEELIAVSLSTSVIALLLWIFWARPDKIKVPADGYAKHLLEFCEQMDPPSTTPSNPASPPPS